MAISKEIEISQSSWTKGMQSKVLSARNDTDILSKGATILDNVIIMQQGGLRKRPCAKKTYAKIENTLAGIVTLGNKVWAINYNPITYTVKFIQIDEDNQSSNDFLLSGAGAITPDPSVKLNYVQDGDTILFVPYWQIIIYDGNSFRIEDFKFNSYPISPKNSNSDYFRALSGNYDPKRKIYLYYYGEGNNDAMSQAQTQYTYISVGNTVLLYVADGTPIIQFKDIIGTFLFINGLIIKITSTLMSSLIGVVMYGSTPVQALTKISITPNGWANVWSITINAEDILFQTNSFDNTCPPYKITNYQNRLITANTLGKNADSPNNIPVNNTTLWCSASGIKFSYLQTTSDDNSAFSVVISGDISPTIYDVVAYNYLYVTTDNGIYAFTNNTNSTFTPTNINLQKIGYHRCADIKPVQHDGQLFYVHVNNRSIFSLSQDSTGNILDIDRTILCPSFVRNVSYLCSTNYINNINNDLSSDNSSYLLALSDEIDQETNLTTGKKCILSYQYMQSQGLDGWTRWTFKDKYPNALFTHKDRIFALFDDTGLKTLYEFKLGIFFDEFDIPSVPDIKIKTHPFSFRDQLHGDLLFKRKKYSKIYLYCIDTITITINGEVNNIGAKFDNTPVTPYTGIVETIQYNNYDNLTAIEIGHNDNSDFCLIALSTKLEVE